MPTKNYSHMVMEIKHMVDGDGVGDDGDQEALEMPLSGVESGINQPPKTKIMVAAVLWFAKASSFWKHWFSRYIRTCIEGEAEWTSEAQTGMGGAVSLLDRATCALFAGRVPPVSGFFSNSLFFMKTSVIFSPKFISIDTNRQKRYFAKNSVTFCRFISYLVRFRSKTMSKVLGKVDAF
jgi:hypothetical protein